LVSGKEDFVGPLELKKYGYIFTLKFACGNFLTSNKKVWKRFRKLEIL
jgi:hypothetical protein